MEPFLSEIRIFSFGFAPKGWALCNGQLLAISQNQPLFSLLGTTYGGDGRVNFALPNLQGRVPMHTGNGHVLGESSGDQLHRLTTGEMPAHTHAVNAISNSPANQQYPAATTLWAGGSSSAGYQQSANVGMDPLSVLPAGESEPHENRSPYLALNFSIALQGIFPPRN